MERPSVGWGASAGLFYRGLGMARPWEDAGLVQG